MPVRMTNLQKAIDKAATHGSRSYSNTFSDGAVESGVVGRTSAARSSRGCSRGYDEAF